MKQSVWVILAGGGCFVLACGDPTESTDQQLIDAAVEGGGTDANFGGASGADSGASGGASDGGGTSGASGSGAVGGSAGLGGAGAGGVAGEAGLAGAAAGGAAGSAGMPGTCTEPPNPTNGNCVDFGGAFVEVTTNGSLAVIAFDGTVNGPETCSWGNSSPMTPVGPGAPQKYGAALPLSSFGCKAYRICTFDSSCTNAFSSGLAVSACVTSAGFSCAFTP